MKNDSKDYGRMIFKMMQGGLTFSDIKKKEWPPWGLSLFRYEDYPPETRMPIFHYHTWIAEKKKNYDRPPIVIWTPHDYETEYDENDEPLLPHHVHYEEDLLGIHPCRGTRMW